MDWVNNFIRSFRDLPDLPEAKLWIDGGKPGEATVEQIITNKLMQHNEITKLECNQLKECIIYYDKLYTALENFYFSALSETEIDNFVLYISNAFNFLPIQLNTITLYRTFRLVINNGGESKKNVQQLSYPPLEVVKNKKLYNRANSPNSTVFYSSESIDVAFKELKPIKGSIVTIGIWEPKENDKFNSYPIMLNPSSQFINENALSATTAYNEIKRRIHVLLGQFFDGYFKLLTRQYSKFINDNKEYIISALFSERIFEIEDQGWNIDCIIYPSVNNEHKENNLAFKSSVVSKRLKLRKALEYEVLETFYERSSNNKNPAILTVANARIIKKSVEILENGEIIWELI